jgi:DNA ligase (NAD+)
VNFDQARSRAAELTAAILDLQDAYYRRDSLLVSDAEYDELMRELEAIEWEYPELQGADSPTQAVGFGRGELFSPVVHAQRMFSLDNVFDDEEMALWASKITASFPQALGGHAR